MHKRNKGNYKKGTKRMSILSGKNLLLGISGGIAAYKVPFIVRELIKKGANVKVILTKNATQFLNPNLFTYLLNEPPYIDTFFSHSDFSMNHISFQKWADLLVVVPATANIIGKFSNGIADDLLTTTFLSVNCPILICPAMNSIMYSNPVVEENIKNLQNLGIHILEPEYGSLLCGEEGKGRLPRIEKIILEIEKILAPKYPFLESKKVLFTIGPSREYIDPIRFISNGSSGKMGFSIAKYVYLFGAKEMFILKNKYLSEPLYPAHIINCTSTLDFFNNYKQLHDKVDICFFTAALADFRPKEYQKEKIKKNKKNSLKIELVSNPDISKWAGENKRKGQIFIGFSAETDNAEKNTLRKMEEKNLDAIILNKISHLNPFGSDYNEVTIYFRSGKKYDIEQDLKKNIGRKILEILSIEFGGEV